MCALKRTQFEHRILPMFSAGRRSPFVCVLHTRNGSRGHLDVYAVDWPFISEQATHDKPISMEFCCVRHMKSQRAFLAGSAGEETARRTARRHLQKARRVTTRALAERRCQLAPERATTAETSGWTNTRRRRCESWAAGGRRAYPSRWAVASGTVEQKREGRWWRPGKASNAAWAAVSLVAVWRGAMQLANRTSELARAAV
mmetsp:Transcript_59200/g.135804  ORF Transcript_59200/g.135804 Transcript_59200/m.135804 type:complete len:201 (+) Transcript_59200:236-838(+)